jgi:1-acyl-sn-glycerol-3-phosphate acyltransferase
MAAVVANPERRAPSAGLVGAWPRALPARVVRRLLQATLLVPLVRVLCRPFRVENARRLAREPGPVVFIANHASHADTPAILAALPRRVRLRTAPAAAEDYFFRGRVRGALAAIGIGAFPFPRRGSAGLDRAEQLLAHGWNVLLFPEGTRSADGRMREFKPGAAVLALRGATIVPVGLAGTAEVMPKNARFPRRAPVSIVFGEPVCVESALPAPIVAVRMERRVSRLRAAARLLRPPRRRSWLERAASFARSPAGLWFAFGWGVAEALMWPIVPDVPVALLAVAAPSRFLALAASATAGSLLGGTAAYGLGAIGAGTGILAHAPLVTERMHGHALAQMSADGATPLLAQPWTGVPYKVFAYQASGAGVAFGPFVALSAVGRGHRILLAAAVFAGAAWPLQRVAKRWVERCYVPFAIAFCAVFSLGLARVVAAWS